MLPEDETNFTSNQNIWAYAIYRIIANFAFDGIFHLYGK